MTATAWTHDDLARDLALHVASPNRMVWTDMQLGPAGSPRPDVYAIDKSFAHPRAITYEVKVSVADFRADVTAGKWQGYLGFSSGVYFAAPSGLISKADVPRGCGLMVRGPDGWRALRAPTLLKVTLTESVCLKLLIDGRDREVRVEPRRERNHYGAIEKIAKRWGRDAARLLGDLEAVRHEVREAQAEEKRIRAAIGDLNASAKRQANALTEHWLDELCRVTNLPRTGFAEVVARVAELRRIALGAGERWRRSNLEAAENALEAELRRIRNIRVALGECDEVPA
jgi:hypothetical protein